MIQYTKRVYLSIYNVFNYLFFNLYIYGMYPKQNVPSKGVEKQAQSNNYAGLIFPYI